MMQRFRFVRWSSGAVKPKATSPSYVSLFKGMKSQANISTRKNSKMEALRKTTVIPEINKHAHHRKKRLRFEYEANQTAALVLPVVNNDLDDSIKQHEAILAVARKNIIEHAARRVDLFFYTLIAYYKTGLIPDHGHTVMQYGRGRNADNGKNLTQACHSSFFGMLIDRSSVYATDGVMKEYDSLLSGTHFLQSLNATVELPGFVNKLDDELENTCQCRINGLKIIRKVSTGEWDPIQGLIAFFKMMQQAFTDIENLAVASDRATPYLLKDSDDSPMAIKPKLLEYEKQGTFINKWNARTETLRLNYIEMLLRLTPDEKRISAKASEAGRLALYKDKMKAIQAEILQSKESDRTMSLD